MCDEHTTTDKDSKKKIVMGEVRGGTGDNEEVSGECESERSDGMNMDEVPKERSGSGKDGMGKPDDWQIDGKRRGHEPQLKGMHTSNEESATVTISEDSQGTNKEEQEGTEERASGEENNTRDENRSREAKGNEESTPPALPAGTKDGGSQDQEMAESGNNNSDGSGTNGKEGEAK